MTLSRLLDTTPLETGAQEAMRQGGGAAATTPKLRADLHNIRMEVVSALCGEDVRIHATVTNTGDRPYFPVAYLRLFTVLAVDERQGTKKPRYDKILGRGQGWLSPGESGTVTFNPPTPEVQPFQVRVELWDLKQQLELLDWEERTFSFPAPNLQLVPGYTWIRGGPGRGEVKYVGTRVSNSGQRATKGRVYVSVGVWQKGQRNQFAWNWSSSTDVAIPPGGMWAFHSGDPRRAVKRRKKWVDIGIWKGNPDWSHVYWKIHLECHEDFDQRDNHIFGKGDRRLQ